MSHEHLERIEELARALDLDVDRPEDLQQRIQWLERHRAWLHAIQELTLTEIESNYRMQLVARDEIHKGANDGL